MKIYKLIFLLALVSVFNACNNNTPDDKQDDLKTNEVNIKESAVGYAADTLNMNGFIYYDEATDAKRPAVLVVHEWWGLNDYVRRRAKELAEMGYITMAVDMFGNGATAADPQQAMQLATPFYKDPTMTKIRLEAALKKIKEFSQTDSSKIAAIGYCFGGFVVLNAAKQGSDFAGVVSFHGGLAGVPPSRDMLKAKVLVLHGGNDKFVSAEEVSRFRHAMDSINADYTYKEYPNATHAFTNPEATEKGKKFNIPIEYNAAADTASWNDMKSFLGTIFK